VAAVATEGEGNFECQSEALALECKLNSNVVAKITGKFTADVLKISNFSFTNRAVTGRK
jgi:hypothetical protein